MRKVERHPERVAKLTRTPERDRKIRDFIQYELEAAISARHRLEAVWREARRQYEAIPRQAIRTSPIPNSPNIEIPIGAIAVDSIYAAAIDALFAASPLLITRPTNPRWTENAKSMQLWVNWMTENEVMLRSAVENAFLDDCQLGTGAYYIPFCEVERKTDIHQVIQRGPQIVSIPPENLILPGGSDYSVHDTRWVGVRFWYTPTEVRDRARANKSWDISKAMPVARVDTVRAQREEFGAPRSGLTVRELFEFIDIYCYFDYDEDGIDEDLLLTWDRSANQIIALTYNPYDSRPLEKMVYQPRAHVPYGIGVMEMSQPFQDEATELHNFKILNAMLASCRLWVTETGSGIDESMEVWPNRVVQVNDINKLKELKMSDAFPQIAAFEESGMRLAESRTGLRGELSLMSRGGSRTPATTTLSLLQQTNRRFTPAFDQMRLTTAAAVRQAIVRYSERAKLGDQKVYKHLQNVIGDVDAELVWQVLRQPNFEDAVAVEFTATSAIVSREADRQNAILLTQAMDNQHQRIAELVGAVSQPGTPEQLRNAVIKMIDAKNEMFDRLLRTFDLVRDPQTFIANVGPELRAASDAATEQQAIMDALLGGLIPQPAAVPGIAEPPAGGPPGIA